MFKQNVLYILNELAHLHIKLRHAVSIQARIKTANFSLVQISVFPSIIIVPYTHLHNHFNFRLCPGVALH